jgi:hypothetical protein
VIKRVLLFALALFTGAIANACSSTTPGIGPAPGNTAPGEACSGAAECGCWSCTCEGVGGAPGAAQLCVSGKCPTGEAACTPICALADAKLASATAVDACTGVP